MQTRGEKGESRLSTQDLLGSLSAARLAQIFRDLEPERDVPKPKELLREILTLPGLKFSALLQSLYRDELRIACAQHQIPLGDSSRESLMNQLKKAHGVIETERPKPKAVAGTTLPERGARVFLRERHWFVTSVEPLLRDDGEGWNVLHLVCLDDDHAGKTLSVLWELELGARRVDDSELSPRLAFDKAHLFGAYFRAISWNQVTAAGVWRHESSAAKKSAGAGGPQEILQAPIRAGILQQPFQMVPLLRSVSMPRVNLFIADDVGLGKTIEAGLVMSELFLRHRADSALIVCPASVSLQWQNEMRSRFGLSFEIYNRDYVARKRRERGFAINPFKTYPRFILSYSLLRRPEIATLLEELLNERAEGGGPARGTLLVLDEAHTIAPASASKLYAVDSQATIQSRRLAPKFEHRLFLSATPHNGHSNSFSTLLELLDSSRFTRGVPVDPEVRDEVMIRRLKRDVQQAFGGVTFPERKLVRHEIGSPKSPEVLLGSMLAEYTEILAPKRGRGKLAFINLQKRLLSSVAAFAMTLRHHSDRLKSDGDEEPSGPSLDIEDKKDDADDETELLGKSEDVVVQEEAEEIQEALRTVVVGPKVSGGKRAAELVHEMTSIASKARVQPDEKVTALTAWMRKELCAGIGMRSPKPAERKWSGRKVILFTEYVDTKRYWKERLLELLEGTDDPESRIVEIYGGMSDEDRSAVQDAFNSPPETSPARILLATDAAREGINLQGYCQDLFHIDLPWNPSRMEQRNGRIDRALQPEREVRCHYFVYPDRAEDRVLDLLVRKVDTIQKELGSVGEVVKESLGRVLEAGIRGDTAGLLEAAAKPDARLSRAKEELETKKKKLEKSEIDAIDEALQNSKDFLRYDSSHLRQVVERGLEMAGFKDPLDMDPRTNKRTDSPDEYTIATSAPGHWERTLDTLRRARKPGTSLWDWRRREPHRPVVFEALTRLDESKVQLHLDHPLVKRVLDGFLAQGSVSSELVRRTIVVDPKANLSYAILIGRLSLFGEGATRLHDQIIAVSARLLLSKDDLSIEEDESKAVREADELVRRMQDLMDDKEIRVDPVTRERLLGRVVRDEAALTTRLKKIAGTLTSDVEIRLKSRAKDEARALAATLRAQKDRIDRELEERRQRTIAFTPSEREEAAQYKRDEQHLRDRRMGLDLEAIEEVRRLTEGYKPVLDRFEPVGLVYLIAKR